MIVTTMDTHQVDHAGRSGFVLGALGKEEQALACLTCPCCGRVLRIGLFRAQESGQRFSGRWLFREPEEVFGED